MSDARTPPLILFPEDEGNFGGKAGALRALQGEGFPIPPWFAVSPEAQTQSVPKNQPMEAWTLSASLLSDLELALERLGGERFAVRSSASDEDGGEHSFAGQLESYLFVAKKDVAARVADVWRSAFSERIHTYRKEHGLGAPLAPAVLVQRLIHPESAGVAFGADPISGRWQVCLVSGVLGVGTALVSGVADADTWFVDASSRIIERQIAQKAHVHGFSTEHAEGVEAIPVSAEIAALPCLDDAQVLAVAVLVRRCGTHFRRPQDIEWAFEGGQLYLLQSRPITTLGRVPDPDGALALWDNSNIAESYGGLTTPLTYSFARRAYEEVYRQFCRIMGVSEKVIEDHATTFRGMIGLLRGRVYYNLIAWYRVLAMLPGFQFNRRFMEQMMGVKEGMPESLLSEFTTPSLGAKVLDFFRLLRAMGGLLRNHWTLKGQIRRFYERLNQALAEPSVPFSDQGPDELVAAYRSLERRLLTHWDAPLVNDFFAMIFYGVLKGLCGKWCGDQDGTLQNDLVGGEGGIVSAEPAARVKRIAESLRPHTPMAELLRAGTVSEIHRGMLTHPELRAEIESYLAKFGDRCMEELKLESSTLVDDPIPLYRAIGHMAARPPSNATDYATQARAVAEARVDALLRGPKRWLFHWVLKHARDRVRNRENLRFERTRLFGRVRRLLMELGHRLHAVAKLDAPRDVFHLEVEELLGFVEGTSTCDDLRGLAAVRKAAFVRHAAEPDPADRFQTWGWVNQGQSYQDERTEKLEVDPLARKGTGACPGIVRGPVRVVRDPRGVELVSGTILVALQTDPGWIMLFPAASGLLVERGSLLSHSAIVARELGLPAVVGIPGLTTWLKDGDLVEFDGGTGQVRRLSQDLEPEQEFHAQ
jgi:rifampicin phosphotransferase